VGCFQQQSFDLAVTLPIRQEEFSDATPVASGFLDRFGHAAERAGLEKVGEMHGPDREVDEALTQIVLLALHTGKTTRAEARGTARRRNWNSRIPFRRSGLGREARQFRGS